MACLEEMVKDFKCNMDDDQDARGGGMTEYTPVWICAFANNQHDLESEITASHEYCELSCHFYTRCEQPSV